MAAFPKPPVLAPWGNTNMSSADMVQPGAGLINTGFLPPPVVPDREHVNWFFNMVHNAVRYQMTRSVADWDTNDTANYAVGALVFYATNGKYYRCISVTPAGTAPNVDTSHWAELLLIPGTLLRRTRITATSTLASIAGCTRARFKMVGCGGGGAGSRGTTNPEYVAAGGGASGSWGEFETTVIPGTWSFTMGSPGTGGAAPIVDGTLNPGTDGGSAVLFDGTNTFTCPGGHGAGAFDGGAPGGVPTASPGGTIIRAVNGEWGEDGADSGSAPTSPVKGGDGGTPGEFGTGGRGPGYTFGNGRPGTGDGAGGSGSYSAVPGHSGGAGSGPAIILEEWS